jgi:hypothetical protein
MEWEFEVFENDIAYFSSVQLTSDDGYILTGVSEDWATGNMDLWLVKVRTLPDTTLVINDFQGGKGLTASINNVGDAEAIDITWSLRINGGTIFTPHGGVTSGTIESLHPGEAMENTIPIVGFGGFLRPVTITLTAEAVNAELVEKTVPARILLFFVLV